MKFAQPAWFVLLVLLPLLGVAAVLVARLRRKQWAAFVAPRLRGVLLQSGSQLPRWFALLFLLAACAAILIALARPQGVAGVRTEKSLGRNLLIALDLSRSMRVRDVKPDRLSQAKMVIFEMLDAMPNERIGLIGFAGAAYVYAPLTVDHAAVRETVEQIDESWAPVGGSNLAEAVHLAADTLRKTGQKNNALVILSDGERHEGNLDSAITEAAHAGVYILAIGVGTEDGDYVPDSEVSGKHMVDRFHKPIISRLQPEVLRKLAAETKGRFAVAGSGMDIPKMVKSAIKDLDAFEMEGRERTVYIEFYQWLTLPAILFLLGSVLAGTRWRRIRQAAILTVAMVLTPATARADSVSAAKDALGRKQYPAARDAYAKLADNARSDERAARFRVGEATAAYRAEDFKRARSAFSGALLSGDPAVLSNSHAGLGNTLFQLGWRNLANESYPQGSSNVPDLRKFDALVRERLAKLCASADPAGDDTAGIAAMEELITNWTDAVRHYDSARAIDRSSTAAGHNRRTTLIYLKRLAELIQEDKQQSEQALPQPQPGEGAPQQGEGDPKEKKDGDQGDGNKGSKPPADKGKSDDHPKDGPNQDPQKPDDKTGSKKDDKDADQGTTEPGETPEDRARRILKENADLERGPLTPGRREFQVPKQDW